METREKLNSVLEDAKKIIYGQDKMLDAIMAGLVCEGHLLIEVEINTRILFSSGEAQLFESALPVLHKVAQILAPYPNPINVEGFTDNIPISTSEVAGLQPV